MKCSPNLLQNRHKLSDSSTVIRKLRTVTYRLECMWISDSSESCIWGRDQRRPYITAQSYHQQRRDAAVVSQETAQSAGCVFLVLYCSWRGDRTTSYCPDLMTYFSLSPFRRSRCIVCGLICCFRVCSHTVDFHYGKSAYSLHPVCVNRVSTQIVASAMELSDGNTMYSLVSDNVQIHGTNLRLTWYQF